MLRVKDYLRDYSTAAFRFYARLGRPTYEEMKKVVYDAAFESSRRELINDKNIKKPTQQAVINAEKAVEALAGELCDILAVEKVLARMQPEMIKAVEIIYFTDAERELMYGDITARVHKTESVIPASESQIYRWLKQARMMFAVERGLRLPSSDSSEIDPYKHGE